MIRADSLSARLDAGAGTNRWCASTLAHRSYAKLILIRQIDDLDVNVGPRRLAFVEEDSPARHAIAAPATLAI